MRTPTVTQIKQAVRLQANPERAHHSLRFFKTGKGEYGEGDRFLGLTVPQQRVIARQFRLLPFRSVFTLLKSAYHEHRLIALFILVDQYEHGDAVVQRKIVEGYVRHIPYVNNWDLVDSSAPYILGDYLLTHTRRPLYTLVSAPLLWRRRVAIVATQAFIRAGEYDDTLRIAKQLLHDDHDLIHKAVGWMLREVGKKDRAVLVRFLNDNAARMPRTMLRYAIEHFSKTQRKHYLAL